MGGILTVHLLRMAVGIDSISHLKTVQKDRMGDHDEGLLHTYTRNIPRRKDELLDGGSIYWVVKRYIRVRQAILGVEQGTNAKGRNFCALQLSPDLVMLDPRRQKAFQGWRYLRLEDAPVDIDVQSGNITAETSDMPMEMVDELRDLGLL